MANTTTNMGLKQWNLSGDFFSYSELSNDWSLIDSHDHTAGKGVQIPTTGIQNLAITTPKIADGSVNSAKLATGAIGTTNIADGSITTPKLATNAVTTLKITNGSITADKLADAAKLGLTDSSSVRRGKSIIATTETRTNTAYGLLTTPDRVQNIVLPTDDLIYLIYDATFQSSVSVAGSAAIFLNGVQAQISIGSGMQFQAAGTGAITNRDQHLFTTATGLVAENQGSAYAGGITTGQIMGTQIDPSTGSASLLWGGCACIIEAAAGTYDVSIQFKATSGSITAKNRKLWVWVRGF